MSDAWIPYIGGRPEYQTSGSCAADLVSIDLCTIEPGEFVTVRTGTFLAIPKDHVGLICPRSGLASKSGVTVLNGPGVVDTDYRGEVKVVLVNTGREPYVVRPGDRIAQLLLIPCSRGIFVPCDPFEPTKRGAAGFGSTGT